METYYERLAALLLEKNSSLSPEKARTWVELLWEDFETTRAKAGRDYQGKEVTERIVRQMIDAYGDKLHHFAALNPKYSELLKDENDLNH